MSAAGHQPHPSGMSDGNYPSLPEPLVDELQLLLHGQVFARTDREFQPRTTIFNGNVVTPAKAVVIPASASDVSLVLKFCTKHGLLPSIKAGGYGTAGWSINGDIVVDLSKLNDIDIETPSPDGGFISLKDTPLPNSKGKAKISGPSLAQLTSPPASESNTNANPGKRRRSSEVVFESGLPRDPLVARFLRMGDLPPRAIRRRLDAASSTPTSTVAEPESYSRVPAGAESMTRQSSSESQKTGRTLSNDGSSTSTSTSTSTSASTSLTAPSSAPTSPETRADESDEKHEGADALGVIASVSAGLYDQRSAAAHLLHDAQLELETPMQTPHAEQPPPSRTPSFSVRLEDPFGYMSAAPGAPPSLSSVRPPRGYEQPVFQTGSTTAAARPPASSGSSGVAMLVDGTAEGQSPFLDSSPRPSFLSAATTPVHPNAFVSFGAGVKQKDIDLFTAAHPLPATSASGSVSSIAYHVPLAAHPVGSSVMILGGFGFLSRLYGLSIDALVEVEMVLADGSIVFVNEKDHPDLWWALRGAGPAFGVVTRYKALAYPVPVVFAGNLIYNFRAATAASLIKHFRDCVKAAPRELYANVLLTAGPADKGSLIVVQLCYIGAQEKGRAFLQAIASWDGEPCLLNEVSEKSFLSQQDSVAQILRGKAGRQWYIRSALITSLPDEVIHKTVNDFADTPVGCTWLFELAGGAVADAEDTCLPKAQREAGFTIAAFHQWELDDDDPLCVTTAENWIDETLSPVSTGGPYPAFLGRHEKAQRIMGCYGENWARLCEVKRKYDPHGLFSNTFWPLDVDGNTLEPCLREPASPIMQPREL